jgi:tRNA modification GTPase
MSYNLDDTIAAIASAAGGADRGIVRVSGPGATDIAVRCFSSNGTGRLDEVDRGATMAGRLRLELDGQPLRPLPCDLFLWPSNRSYTRQPVAEFHTFGSPPLVSALLRQVCRAGARLAEPGEFTLRAFLAGRLDLTQAEAVLGIIDAQMPDQLRTALGQLAGGLATPLHRLRTDLLDLLAELEAGLDFVEEDIEFISTAELVKRLHVSSVILRQVAARLNSRNVDATAPKVVLVGAPNAGKSSLFNALAKRFAPPRSIAEDETSPAIVSPHRGTTRDYLTGAIDIGGTRCTVVDTAGIDEGSAANLTGHAADIHMAGQALSGAVGQQAALRLLCVDATAAQTAVIPDDVQCDLVVYTKGDLVGGASFPVKKFGAIRCVVTSSVSGQGLDLLREEIRMHLDHDAPASRGAVVASTAERCGVSICAAQGAVAVAAELAETGGGHEFIAAELRTALTELGKVVGEVYTDDILDRIFSSFCIGK